MVITEFLYKIKILKKTKTKNGKTISGAENEKSRQ